MVPLRYYKTSSSPLTTISVVQTFDAYHCIKLKVLPEDHPEIVAGHELLNEIEEGMIPLSTQAASMIPTPLSPYWLTLLL
jgi:hypothetical protein